MADFEGFLARLTPFDLRARRAPSAAAYRARYLRSLRPLAPAQAARVRAAFAPARVDAALRRGGLALPRPWPPLRAATHADPDVEGGLPHTMSFDYREKQKGGALGAPFSIISIIEKRHVIILPDSAFAAPAGEFAATLHHEYVHVLQRAFPRHFAAWYRRWGLAEVPLAALPAALAARRRANPDAMSLFAPVDLRKIAGAPWINVYPARGPRALTDCERDPCWEHPHETVAYAVEDAFVRR
jgi:hypothetical protein